MKKIDSYYGYVFTVICSLSLLTLPMYGHLHSHCRVATVSSSEAFYRILGKARHALVQFCPAERKGKSCRLHCPCSYQTRMLDYISSVEKFSHAGLQCIRVLIDDCEHSQLALEYNLTALPVYILFRNSTAIRYPQGEIVTIKGNAPYEMVIDSIERYLGKSINYALKKRAEYERQEHKERLARYYYYAPYLYMGWPYGCGYWGGGCYGGCGFGIGFGGGCGRCW